MARVLLLATIFAAPWAFGAVQPWGWGTLMVAALLVLVLWAVGCVHRGVLSVSWSPLYWPFLAFLLIAIAQLLVGWTADHVATREAVLKLVTNFVLFFLAGQLLFTQPENGRALRLWGLVVTLLALAMSVLALAQIMTTGQGMIYWSVPTNYGPFGPYVSPNDYCGLMEMLIPVSAGYILSGSSPKVPRWLLWVLLGVALATIAMSGSRGGGAVILVELLLFGFIIFRYRPHGAWRRVFPIVVALILISAGLFAWLANAGRRATRGLEIFQTDKSVQVKMGDRFWVARDTLRMARSHPVLGNGVGTFETVFPAYMSHVSDLHWTHAHDDFAEVLAETGLVGGALLLWGLVLFFRRAFLHLPARLRADWSWIPIGAAVGAVGLLCHSLVDFNLRLPANAAWFVVCVAVATHPGSWPDRPTRVARVSVPERNEDFIN
jgi:O-antigen ligase